jgi:hypothetical protein
MSTETFTFVDEFGVRYNKPQMGRNKLFPFPELFVWEESERTAIFEVHKTFV